MRNTCITVLESSAHLDSNSSNIDANQIVAASFHFYFDGDDPTAAGTFSIEGSNDTCSYGNLAQDFVVTNWSQVDSVGATDSKSRLLTVTTNSYRWLRVKWVDTGTGIQSITIPEEIVFSDLASTYFYWFGTVSKPVTCIFWFTVDGVGDPPSLPGDITYIEVPINSNFSVDDVLGALETAFANLGTVTTSIDSPNRLIEIQNNASESFEAAYDFDTGFIFAVIKGGTNNIVVNMNAVSV